MKYVLIVAFAASAVLVCSQAQAQSPTDFSAMDAKLKACSESNPSNPGVSNCTVTAIASANRRLDDVYAEALNTLNHPSPKSAPYNAEIPTRLIAAERAWIAFRDAECQYKSTIALGGSGEGYAYVACIYDQTKARVKALMAPDDPHIAR